MKWLSTINQIIGSISSRTILNNGLDSKEVNRIESRLTWNYIRYLRIKKQLDINVETI